MVGRKITVIALEAVGCRFESYSSDQSDDSSTVEQRKNIVLKPLSTKITILGRIEIDYLFFA